MKLLALSALVVAYLSTVASKFEFGKCPGEDLTGVAFDDYDITEAFPHYIFSIDGGLLSLATGLEEAFGFKPELDLQCGQLGEIEPWYTMATTQADDDTTLDGIEFYYDDEDIWLSVLNDRDDAILKMTEFYDGADEEFEAYYMCMDSSSFPAFLEFIEGFGIEPSASIGSLINSGITVFQKLGMNFKVHGGFVTGYGANYAAKDLGFFLQELDAYIPGYEMAEMKGLAKTENFCPDLDLTAYSVGDGTTSDMPYDYWMYELEELVDDNTDDITDLTDRVEVLEAA